MTSGTKTIDSRASTLTPDGKNNYVVGAYSTKTWSGTNYPVVKPSYTNVYVPGQKRPRRVFVRPPKRGRIEEHPYSVSYNSYVDVIFRYPFAWTPQYTTAGGNGQTSLTSVDYGWTANDDLALYGKLREAVAGSDFNAGIFLAEGKESLKLIAESAVRIAKGLRALKKLDFRSAHDVLTDFSYKTATRAARSRREHVIVRATKAKNLSQSWLELQYGWLPLLKDAEAGAQFLAHMHSVPLQHIVTVSRSAKGGSCSTASPSLGKYFDVKSGSRTRIKAILREKDVVALAGLTDPLAVAWELVPYSFVVDWFIPIGNYLSARGLSQALTGTFVISTKREIVCKDLRMKDGASYYKVAGATVKQGSFSRTVSTSLSIPLPCVKPLEKVASWRHCANAVALLVGMKTQ